MKIRILSIALLCVVFSAFPYVLNAQDVPEQTQGEKEVAKTTEVIPPDTSKLNLLETEFFVVRQTPDGPKIGWTNLKMDSDTQLFRSEFFSKDKTSEVIIASLIYPLKETKPCAIFFKEDGVPVYAIVLENGKVATTEGGEISPDTVSDEKTGLVGVRVILLDSKGNKVVERKFLFPPVKETKE